jgi:3-oxoadipate enol-lactonase
MLINIEAVGAINVATTAKRDGSPLLLLHPVGLDLSWWGPQFEAFGRDRQVISFDMPGHGQSDGLLSPPSFEIMAQAAASIIKTVAGRPVDVVGVSVGGMIAQTLALRRPDLVRSLSLVATLCTFSDQVRYALRERARIARHEGMARIADLSNERWFTPAFRARRPDMMERTRRSLLQQSGEFHAAMWEMISGLDLEAQIPAISCPTLVVTGTADGNAPPAAAETIVKAIPGATLYLMPEVGHFPPFEVPDAFNDVLADFFRGVDTRHR